MPAPDTRPSYTEGRSVFAELAAQVYCHRWLATLSVPVLRGGVPSDPKVAEGWIRTKFGDKDAVIRELVEETIAARLGGGEPADRAVAVEQAIAEVADTRCLNGFKRTPDGELYIEARQIKAMIKEAANIRWAKGRWGPTSKGTRSWFAEHVFIPDAPILIRDENGKLRTFVDEVAQDFVHSRFGAAIKYAETVWNATVQFTVNADWDLDAERAKDGEPRSWGHLWVTAEQQGLGADRSQGFGAFQVTRWERIS